MDNWKEWLEHPLAQPYAGFLGLALLAWLASILVRQILTRVMGAVAIRTFWIWDDALIEHGTLNYLGHIAATLVFQFGIGFVPDLPEELSLLIRNVAMACTILFILLSIGAALNALEDLYNKKSGGKRSIKSHIQFIKIASFIIGTVVIVATLIDRSPLILLSGLGAMSAILLLVFKDTILGFVAGVQLTTNNMLHVGDWIEVPAAGADGEVIDIALHTVKVQNWDMTITSIPTWKLIADPFKNWRGMSDSGGRRIKRSLLIDAGSVHFINGEDIERMSASLVLREYLADKTNEVSRFNVKLGDAGQFPLNQLRLTNLGTFRAYALAYLNTHDGIHQDMALMVRQLEAKGEGIPLELYCFTNTTAWSEYEGILSDIFDHLIAIVPEFGLRLYQKPAGGDLRDAVRELGRKSQSSGQTSG